MRSHVSHSRSARRMLGGLLAAVLVAAPAAAQQTGSIVGTVVDKSGRQPLNGAQLQVDGSPRGALTDGRGRFTIVNVPAGQVTVRVVYIGYRTETQQVRVTAGQAATVNFELGVSAVALDELVVTGTGGEVERKQLGASLSSINVASVQERVPVTDVGSVLQSRIAGVRSIGTVGGVGASRDLRIRGTSSFNLTQRPVIYIDGVKIDTKQTVWQSMGTGCCSFSGGAGVDRLSDLNPNDIDRIEVIKGAAAGTLYGTEATNGVIQIFTKKGRSDSPPRWSAQLTTGLQRYRENFQTKLYPQFTGPDGTQALDANKALIEDGPYTSGDVTVQGGGQSMTYFVSGGYTNEQGSVQPNWMKRGNLRLNLHWLTGENLSFDVTSAYTRNRIFELQSGNNWTSLLGNAVLGVPYQACTACNDGHARPFGEPWVPVASIKAMENIDDTNRWTGSVTANYSPFSNFTNKVQVGLDAVSEELARYQPFGHPYTYRPKGEKGKGYRNFRSVTAEYLGSVSFDEILPQLGTRISFGAQGFQTVDQRNMAVGQEFAAPGVSTVRGGTIRTGDEFFEEQVQVGFFAQNRLAYMDRVFVTTGVRVDGNSAFGDDYGFQVYPNLQLSYDASGTSWVPGLISNLRLRGAIGTAGLAPGAFDKFLTFTPFTTGDDESAVRASTGGNQELGPERTTEIEAGFEAGFWNDRIGLDVTAYRRDTKDAIATVGRAPSTAFGSSPRENIGGIRDEGYEAALRLTPIESSRLRWSTDVRVDGNHNEVTDLGMEADTTVKRRGGLRLGFPVRTYFARVPCTEKYVAAGACTNAQSYDPVRRDYLVLTDTTVYFGKTLPDFNLSWGNELTFGAFRLYGLVTHESGAWFGNSDRPYRANFRTGDEYLSALAPAGSASCVTSWATGAQGPRFADSAKQWCQTVQSDSIFNRFRRYGSHDKRDNIRIREISAAYVVPDAIASRLRMGRTMITFAAQNVQWWDDCNCVDPNMTYRGGADFGETAGFLAMPQPRMFKFSIRTTF
ncbi:MAG TPA: TonB-dependent receptor [Longimicrobiales bacterium]|nr:TonB-dependent receptor [Longimicrobiales bacterium]